MAPRPHESPTGSHGDGYFRFVGVATVEVFRAQSDRDREELFAFRYSVYVEELGRFRRTADHERHWLVEPEDAWSVLYGARENGRVVGTTRLTFGACEPHLLSMNLSAGGRPYAERNINSEEVGYLIPLVFLAGDADGLARAIGGVDDSGDPCLPPTIAAAFARTGGVHSAAPHS